MKIPRNPCAGCMCCFKFRICCDVFCKAAKIRIIKHSSKVIKPWQFMPRSKIIYHTTENEKKFNWIIFKFSTIDNRGRVVLNYDTLRYFYPHIDIFKYSDPEGNIHILNLLHKKYATESLVEKEMSKTENSIEKTENTVITNGAAFAFNNIILYTDQSIKIAPRSLLPLQIQDTVITPASVQKTIMVTKLNYFDLPDRGELL